MTNPAPFLKWVGGKTQLLQEFDKFYPAHFQTYYEPFLGGGAVFFDLYSQGRISKAVISDSNKDLMNCYVAIRDRVEKLLVKLKALQRRANEKDFYYKIARPRFNKIKLKTGLEGDTEKASLLIYLNKTCYNGLYRVNSKGDFNVPWGDYRSPHVYDETLLKSVHEILNDSRIRIDCGDYGCALNSMQKGDFAYLDPPYQPISRTSSFTNYTPRGFTLADQKRLAECVMNLDSRGGLVMLSNSYHPYIRRLYKNLAQRGRIETVYAARAVSSVGTGRGKIPEYLITNYRPGL